MSLSQQEGSLAEFSAQFRHATDSKVRVALVSQFLTDTDIGTLPDKCQALHTLHKCWTTSEVAPSSESDWLAECQWRHEFLNAFQELFTLLASSADAVYLIWDLSASACSIAQELVHNASFRRTEVDAPLQQLCEQVLYLAVTSSRALSFILELHEELISRSFSFINHSFSFFADIYFSNKKIPVLQEDIKTRLTEVLTLLSNSASAVLRICIDKKPAGDVEQDGEHRHQSISEPIARFIGILFSGFQHVGIAAVDQGIHFGIVNIAWKAVVTVLTGIAKAHPTLREEASSFFGGADVSGNQAVPAKQSNPWCNEGVTHCIHTLCHLTGGSILHGVQTCTKILLQAEGQPKDDATICKDLQRAFLLAKFFQNNAIRLALLYPQEGGNAAEAIVGLLIVYGGLLRKAPRYCAGSTRLPPRLVLHTMASVLGPTLFALLNNLLLSERLGDEKKQRMLRLCIGGGGYGAGASGSGQDARQLVSVLLTQRKVDSLSAMLGLCQAGAVEGDSGNDIDSGLLAELVACGQLLLSAVVLHASPSFTPSLLATLLDSLPCLVDSAARREGCSPLLTPVIWPAANCSRFEGLEDKPAESLNSAKVPDNGRPVTVAVTEGDHNSSFTLSGKGNGKNLPPASSTSGPTPTSSPTLHSRLDRGMKMMACTICKLDASQRQQQQLPRGGYHDHDGGSKEWAMSHLWKSFEQLLFCNLTNPHPLAAHLILSTWGFVLRHADLALASRHLHILLSTLRATVWKAGELRELASACGNMGEQQRAPSDPPPASSDGSGSCAPLALTGQQAGGAGVGSGEPLLLHSNPYALQEVVHHTASAVTSLMVNLPPHLLHDAAVKPLLTALSSLTLLPHSATPQRYSHSHNSNRYNNHGNGCSIQSSSGGTVNDNSSAAETILEACESLCLLLQYGVAGRLLQQLPETLPPIVRTCYSLSRSMMHTLMRGSEGREERETRMAAASYLLTAISAVLTAFRHTPHGFCDLPAPPAPTDLTRLASDAISVISSYTPTSTDSTSCLPPGQSQGREMLLTAAFRLLSAVLSVWQEGAGSLVAQEENAIHAALLSVTGSFSALESACDPRLMAESGMGSSRQAAASVTSAVSAHLVCDLHVPGPLALLDAALALIRHLTDSGHCCWRHEQSGGSRMQLKWCEDEAAVKLVTLSLDSKVTSVRHAAERLLSALDCPAPAYKLSGEQIEIDLVSEEGDEGVHCGKQQPRCDRQKGPRHGIKCRLVTAITEMRNKTEVEDERGLRSSQIERLQQTNPGGEIELGGRVARLNSLFRVLRNTKVLSKSEAEPVPMVQEEQEAGRHDTTRNSDGSDSAVLLKVSGFAEETRCIDDAETGHDAADAVISAVDALKAAAAKLRKSVNKGEKLEEKTMKLLKKKLASAGGSIREIQSLLEQ